MTNHPTNLKEILPSIRKEGLRNLPRLSPVRILIPLQNLLLWIFLKLGINSRQLTLIWVVASLSAYALSAVGTPVYFVTGALLLFFAITVDLCDGEVGRFQARTMTPEEDLRTHIQGMFFDRMAHTVLTPIWPWAIAFGLYRMHEQAYVFIAAVVMVMYHSACRGLPHLRAYLRELFLARAKNLLTDNKISPPAEKRPKPTGILAKLAKTIEIWVRNGKYYNFMLLVCALIDLGLMSFTESTTPRVLLYGFVANAAIAVLLLLHMLWVHAATPRLYDEMLREASNAEGDTNRS